MSISCGAARFGTAEKQPSGNVPESGKHTSIFQQRTMYDIGIRYKYKDSTKLYISTVIPAGTPIPYTSEYEFSHNASDGIRYALFAVHEAKVSKPNCDNIDTDYTEIMKIDVDHGKEMPKGTQTKSRLIVDNKGVLTIEAYSLINNGKPSTCKIELKNLKTN